jgi:hypothetical protein
VPVIALTLPLALLIGPALAAGIEAMFDADWSIARILLPASALAAAIGTNFVIDWARFERVGDARDQIIVIGMLSAAIIALIPLGLMRPMRPVLLAPALVVAAIPTLAGAFGAGLSANPEPLLSPRVATQARQIRNDALRSASELGGTIVIHPRLVDGATWPFRDGGTLVEASSPPADAAVLIWPADLPVPEGFSSLEGEQALTENVHIPTDTFLDYLHWMIDGNQLVVSPDRIAVYTRTVE